MIQWNSNGQDGSLLRWDNILKSYPNGNLSQNEISHSWFNLKFVVSWLHGFNLFPLGFQGRLSATKNLCHAIPRPNHTR